MRWSKIWETLDKWWPNYFKRDSTLSHPKTLKESALYSADLLLRTFLWALVFFGLGLFALSIFIFSVGIFIPQEAALSKTWLWLLVFIGVIVVVLMPFLAAQPLSFRLYRKISRRKIYLS